jgi:hypothetical protein
MLRWMSAIAILRVRPCRTLSVSARSDHARATEASWQAEMARMVTTAEHAFVEGLLCSEDERV